MGRLVRLLKGRYALLVSAALVAVIALGAAPGAARAGVADPVDERTPEEKELARLRDFLMGPERTFATRRDAAEALLEKDADPARGVLAEALTAPSEAAQAVLEAIGSHDAGHEVFLDPMFKLLASDDGAVRRSAALAFGAFHGEKRVLEGLTALAKNAEAARPARLAAVEALAQLIDRRSVEALVEVTADADQQVAVAAALALSDMTGRRDLGTAPERWAAWWDHHRREPEAKFIRELLRHFRGELRRREADLQSAETRIRRLLDEVYAVADTTEKIRLIQQHLSDPLAEVRAVAARQATVLAREVLAGNNGGREAAEGLISALTKRLADDAFQVRARAAEGVAAWQETSAAPTLLARLEAEKVSEVRAALAAALGTLKVTEAAGVLVEMLASPHPAEVARAAGALGAIGDPAAAGPGAVEKALKPLGDLVRKGQDPAVRESAARALAKIAHPTAEKALVEALDDQAAAVRFSAAQGLGNLETLEKKTRDALAARLQDSNESVRQAVAATLARRGGAEAAAALADRLKPGAETDPAVRNALWAALETMARATGGPGLARDLGERLVQRAGPEDRQRAAAFFEIALEKYPPADGASAVVRELRERLVEAYVAAGTPERAVPALRELIEATPADDAARQAALKRRLGLILLARDPHVDGVALLAEAFAASDPAERAAMVEAVQARTEALLEAEKPDAALAVISALRQAVPELKETDAGPALEALARRAREAAVARAVARLSGTPPQASAAIERLAELGRPAVVALLDALAAVINRDEPDPPAEERLLAALVAVTGRNAHGYDPKAPREDRLAALEAWRRTVPAP